MSYILEALRRSQAERELGRVPTLAGAALVAEDRAEPPRRWPWALVAVALAAVAVLIALYAALRVPPDPGATTPGSALSRPASAPSAASAPALQVAESERQTVPGALVRLPPADRDPRPLADRGFGAVSGALPPPAAAIPGDPGSAVVAAPAVVPVAPLVEAPPPKGLVRVPSPPPGRDPGLAVEPAAPDDAAAQLELELQRQLESDPLLAQDPESMPPAPVREDPGPTPVPADLIAAIDAFKHQVKGGEKDQGKERAPGPTAAVPRVGTASAQAGDQTYPRLTSDQQAALPKFLMSVHVFDAEPARRFVLINGLKYAEGAKTREGLTVEEIRVDGAVLAHQGHRFFVHR